LLRLLVNQDFFFLPFYFSNNKSNSITGRKGEIAGKTLEEDKDKRKVLIK